MARLRAILVAVLKASGRGGKSVGAASNNNMMYAGLALAAMTDVQALVFFVSMMALVIFLPSSGDPLAKAPKDRVELWPLEPPERIWLRLITPWMNPLTWLLFAGLLWRRIGWDLWAFVAGFFLLGFLLPYMTIPINLTWAPGVPGAWRQLIRKNFREFWTALDLYCALLMSLPALFFRLRGSLPDAAHAPLTLMILLMMSTCAQTLFGLEGEGGMTRYRLLPLPGWRILAAKGIAYLTVILILTAPLSPLGGLAGGLVALSTGQYIAMIRRAPQSKWRFRASDSFGSSLAVMIPMLLAAGAVVQLGPVWILPCLGTYLVSLWRCGHMLER